MFPKRKEMKIMTSELTKQIENTIALSKKVFKTDKEIMDFLFSKHEQLDGYTPFNLIYKGEGQRVIDFLEAGLGK